MQDYQSGFKRNVPPDAELVFSYLIWDKLMSPNPKAAGADGGIRLEAIKNTPEPPEAGINNFASDITIRNSTLADYIGPCFTNWVY